ncbi:hypothetical protein bpmyx0001_24940 [Bacillus pseudomycoides DSM 12442]|nr:hypothetical protein bpmyx0001_24940 [Bacillus pseudomycoides DSM 12442]
MYEKSTIIAHYRNDNLELILWGIQDTILVESDWNNLILQS